MTTFPWIFGQTYEHLLLVHWPVPAERLRPLVPPPIDLAMFDGTAWIGHDVYIGTRSRVHGLPPVPGPFTRPVITLRTIVDVGGARGIFLLSLDAPLLFAAWFERHFLHIASWGSRTTITKHTETLAVESTRAEGGEASLRGSYRPVGPATAPAPGSRDQFLLGGDRVYTATGSGEVHVIDVEHGAWALAPADVTFETNTIPRAAGLPGPDGRIAAVYQRSQEAYAALPRKLF